jgi:hypothetical protein
VGKKPGFPIDHSKENIMISSPAMDSTSIERDGYGTIFIKPMPIVAYVVVIIIILFALGALVGGQVILGIGGILGGIVFFIILKNAGTSYEFNTQKRLFRIGTGQNSLVIAFDEIAGFSVAPIKDGVNFTEEQILVIMKNGGGVHIGSITEANQQRRAEKVANLMKYLSESTGIGIHENGTNQISAQN